VICRTVTRIAPPLPVESGIGSMRNADHPTRSKSPELDEWIIRRIVAGYHPKAIVAACDGAISERTAYRWRKLIRGLTVVEVDGYRATFVLRRGQPPSRISVWERAA